MQGPQGRSRRVRGPAKLGQRRSTVAGNATPTLQVRAPRSPAPRGQRPLSCSVGPAAPPPGRPQSYQLEKQDRDRMAGLRSPVPEGHSRAGASPTPTSPAAAALACWLLGCGRSRESWEGHSGGSSSRQSAGHEGQARWVLCRRGRPRGHAVPKPLVETGRLFRPLSFSPPSGPAPGSPRSGGRLWTR